VAQDVDECGIHYFSVGTKPNTRTDAQAFTDNREQVKPTPNIVILRGELPIEPQNTSIEGIIFTFAISLM
jgi:hypothetical protein